MIITTLSESRAEAGLACANANNVGGGSLAVAMAMRLRTARAERRKFFITTPAYRTRMVAANASFFVSYAFCL
jgi:hypothetical protein